MYLRRDLIVMQQIFVKIFVSFLSQLLNIVFNLTFWMLENWAWLFWIHSSSLIKAAAYFWPISPYSLLLLPPGDVTRWAEFCVDNPIHGCHSGRCPAEYRKDDEKYIVDTFKSTDMPKKWKHLFTTLRSAVSKLNKVALTFTSSISQHWRVLNKYYQVLQTTSCSQSILGL